MKLSLLNLESIHKLISSSPSKKYSESFFLLSSLQKNLKDSSVWTDEQEDLFESEALVVAERLRSHTVYGVGKKEKIRKKKEKKSEEADDVSERSSDDFQEE